MFEINIPVSQDFSGRILLTIQNGKLICHWPLRENEHVATLAAFIELVEKCDKQIAESEGNSHA